MLALRVPDEITLDHDELVSLLDGGVEALRDRGIDVMWPKALGRDLTSSAVLDVAPRRSAPGAIQREEATGADHKARREALEQEHAKVSAELEEVMNRWEEEKALVAKMRDLRHQIEAAAVPMPGPDGKAPEGDALQTAMGMLGGLLKS